VALTTQPKAARVGTPMQATLISLSVGAVAALGRQGADELD
jgi:hypothetical protein